MLGSSKFEEKGRIRRKKILELKNDNLQKTARLLIGGCKRLTITLRFLATEESYSGLILLFKILKQAISKIVPVCAVLVNVLKG